MKSMSDVHPSASTGISYRSVEAGMGLATCSACNWGVRPELSNVQPDSNVQGQCKLERGLATSLACDWGLRPELSRMRPDSVVNTTKLVGLSRPLEVSRRTVMTPCPRDFQAPCTRLTPINNRTLPQRSPLHDTLVACPTPWGQPVPIGAVDTQPRGTGENG